MKPIFLILLSIMMSSFGQVAMKWGTLNVFVEEHDTLIDKIIKHFVNLPVILGLCLYALSAVMWVLSISKVPLSYAYPMVAISYVVVFFMSALLFQEQISAMRITGLVIIVIGVFVIAKS